MTALLLGSIHPALALLLLAGAPGRAHVGVAAGRRAGRRGVGGRPRAPGPPPLPRRHHGRAGQGGARDRHRRVAAATGGPRPASATGPRSPRPAGGRRCGRRSAWAVFGVAYVLGIAWVARGLDRSVGDIVLVVVAGQRLSAYIAQSVSELGFLRGVWLDSSLRLTWLEDYAAALEEHATAAPPDRHRRRDPLRARLVPLPGHRPQRPRGRRRHCSRPARSSRSSARTAPGSRRSSSCSAGMYRPTAGRDHGRRRRHRHHVERRRGGAAWPARSRTSSASSCVARQSVGVGDEPRARRRAGRGQRRRSGRCRRRRRAAARRARHPARADVGRRGRGQLRAVAEGGAGPRLHARRAAGARARRADGGARRRDRARPVRALRRRRPRRQPQRAHHACSCRTASRPSAWPT